MPPTGSTAVCFTAPSAKASRPGGAGADLHHGDAELLLLRRQHRFGRGERREDEIDDVQPGALAALDDVLRRGDRRADDVHARLEAHAGHADRLLDAVLPVDQELLRQHVQDVLIDRQRHRARRVEHAVDVRRRPLRRS